MTVPLKKEYLGFAITIAKVSKECLKITLQPLSGHNDELQKFFPFRTEPYATKEEPEDLMKKVKGFLDNRAGIFVGWVGPEPDEISVFVYLGHNEGFVWGWQYSFEVDGKKIESPPIYPNEEKAKEEGFLMAEKFLTENSA